MKRCVIRELWMTQVRHRSSQTDIHRQRRKGVGRKEGDREGSKWGRWIVRIGENQTNWHQNRYMSSQGSTLNN